MKRYTTLLIILMVILLAAAVYAAGPLASAKEDINRVLDVVRDKSLGTGEKKIKLRALSKQVFDEKELSRRTLGVNWRKLNPAQQKEFVDFFGRLLEKTYIDKILSYSNQKIVYSREITFSDNLSEVQTKVITSSGETPINYRMILVDGRWKIYDVIVENVSLIQNYRAQFSSILATKTPAQMLDILKKKVEG